ncbi:MAG: hypothetical protein IB618_04010 [Candidatus Pacearchaeota archaeon]|nr:MAG: hypothetical protein IB618_04010 [Candidatus Pacearchaeota archaeon]
MLKKLLSKLDENPNKQIASSLVRYISKSEEFQHTLNIFRQTEDIKKRKGRCLIDGKMHVKEAMMEGILRYYRQHIDKINELEQDLELASQKQNKEIDSICHGTNKFLYAFGLKNINSVLENIEDISSFIGKMAYLYSNFREKKGVLDKTTCKIALIYLNSINNFLEGPSNIQENLLPIVKKEIKDKISHCFWRSIHNLLHCQTWSDIKINLYLDDQFLSDEVSKKYEETILKNPKNLTLIADSINPILESKYPKSYQKFNDIIFKKAEELSTYYLNL